MRVSSAIQSEKTLNNGHRMRSEASPLISRRAALKYGAAAATIAGVGAAPARAFASDAGATDEPLAVYDMRHLYSIDRSDPAQAAAAYDELQLVTTLQGIVNREVPRLYVRFVTYVQPESDIDGFWLDQLRQPRGLLADRPITQVNDLDSLVRMFRRYLQGAVIYDPAVWATSNVAQTVAGVEDLVAIRYDPSDASLYSRYVTTPATPTVHLPGKIWLVQQDGSPLFTGSGMIPGTHVASSGSAKCDAYLWAKIRYLDTGRCDPGQMGYYLDSYWLTDPARENIQLTMIPNRDYLVSHRGFVFDLSPWPDTVPVDDPDQRPGTDRATLQAILLSAYRGTGGGITVVHGFPPWYYKYNTGGVEDEFVELASAYNACLDADAAGPGCMANASVYAHTPLKSTYPQSPPPSVSTLRKRGLVAADGSVVPKRYVMFYVGDYDSASWVYQNIPGFWEDPARGAVQLNWAFDPNLSERIAPAFLYTRATQTPNDYFVAGDSGAGYLHPQLLDTPRPYSGLPSGLDAWQRRCEKYYRLWDITITGIVLTLVPLDDQVRRAYTQFSPDGFNVSTPSSGYGITGTTPILYAGYGQEKGTPQQAASDLERSFGAPTSAAPYVPEFHYLRSILLSPTWHKQLVDQVHADLPNGEVTFLDAATFFALLRQYLYNQVILRPVAVATAASGTSQLPIQVSNFRTSTATGTVTVTAPNGWTVTPAPLNFTVDAGATQLVWVDLTAPTDQTIGTSVSLPAAVEVAGETRTYGFDVQVFPTVAAARPAGPVTVNGMLDASWANAVPFTVSADDPIVEQYGTVWYVPPEPVTIRAMWDDTHLYFFMQATDSNILAPAATVADGAPWVDDGLALYLALNDWSFKLGATVPTATGQPVIAAAVGDALSSNTTVTARPDAATVGYATTATGYNLEIAIDVTKLVDDYQPAPGTALRFTPLHLDRTATDGILTSVWGQIMWVGADDDPQQWGFLALT